RRVTKKIPGLFRGRRIGIAGLTQTAVIDLRDQDSLCGIPWRVGHCRCSWCRAVCDCTTEPSDTYRALRVFARSKDAPDLTRAQVVLDLACHRTRQATVGMSGCAESAG